MKKIIKRLTIQIAAMLLMIAPAAAVPVAVSAQGPINTDVCKGVGLIDGNKTCAEDADSETSFGGLARRVVNIFSIVVGAVSVIMIIIGGFRYIISGGDSNGVQGAKNTILYAIVGLVIVLFAQIIVRFILSNAAPDA